MDAYTHPVAAKKIEHWVFHCGIGRVVVAGWKPHTQVASVMEGGADDWKYVKVAGHGGLAGLFLSQNADGDQGEKTDPKGAWFRMEGY
jgi:hypothetical protein